MYYVVTVRHEGGVYTQEAKDAPQAFNMASIEWYRETTKSVRVYAVHTDGSIEEVTYA